MMQTALLALSLAMLGGGAIAAQSALNIQESVVSGNAARP